MVSPPASNADGRRPAGLGVRLSRPPPPRAHGEIPKLDKGPPWKGGRRAAPVRGFESHSLRCHPRRRRSEEAIRLVEEPGLNPGGPSGLRAFEPPRFRAAPCRRSSMDRAPVYEAGCSRFDPWRRRSGVLPASRKACLGASPASREAGPSRRSSSGQSAALRRRR